MVNNEVSSVLILNIDSQNETLYGPPPPAGGCQCDNGDDYGNYTGEDYGNYTGYYDDEWSNYTYYEDEWNNATEYDQGLYNSTGYDQAWDNSTDFQDPCPPPMCNWEDEGCEEEWDNFEDCLNTEYGTGDMYNDWEPTEEGKNCILSQSASHFH